MLKKLWILLFLHFGLVGCEKAPAQQSGFFSWLSFFGRSKKSDKSTTSRIIYMNDSPIITFKQNDTEISIESTFPSIKDPEGKYVQSDLSSDDYLPNTSENFYFTTGIEFYKWLNPENYRHLLVFFDNLLERATALEPLQLLYLVRFVDGIIQQLLFDMFNYNNESGIPDPKQAQIMQLAETILTNQRPKFGTKLDGKLSALRKEEIDEINRRSVVQLKNIEALLKKQKLADHEPNKILTLIQNALQPRSEGISPSGAVNTVFSTPAQPTSMINDPGLGD